jgi:hypothetical protein
MTDPGGLADEPFRYHETKRGLVQIAYRGKVVTTLRGREAHRFLVHVEFADAAEVQRVMAKATGHFKHGNERSGKRSERTCGDDP